MLTKNADFIFPNWNAPQNVHAVMTTRNGGVSKAPYDSFNLATHVEDDLEQVLENRHHLKKALNLPVEPFWLEQIHSNTVVEANAGLILPKADASFSTQKNVVCVVMTADCLPVLMCSKNGEKIAAIHAGWRGLESGIISKTVEALKTKELTVWLGAAIGAQRFEVGDDVRDAFLKKSADYAEAFQENGSQWLADIYQLARIELEHLGITDVFGGEFCTVTDADRFYSYRRDKKTGRMATLIWRD
ncbi:MAG: peptidoglycan editing factor PgeF [Methylococcales bacterium]|nr:peptidoglycan editing factor PgeF [Methylococcales bacterium]